MKYEIEIDGQHLAMELAQRNGHINAAVGPRSYDAEVVSPEEGVYLIFVGEDVYEARVSPAEHSTLRVRLRNHVFKASVIDRKHRRPDGHHSNEGPQQLVAPMPGKVVRILVGRRDEVEAGQGIIVVEAMKMQNEIKSPKAGRVIEIRVAEGAAVNANQILAIVE